MDTFILPRLLIIAGTGRDSGKTTFACTLIRKFSGMHSIVAIKISPHFHQDFTRGKIIINRPDFIISEELNSTIPKDSGRMLAAGARKSYFIMTNKDHTGEAFNEVLQLTDDNDYLICESGGIRNFIEPGLFLMMHSDKHENYKPDIENLKSKADAWIGFNGDSFDFDIDRIAIIENRWKLQNIIK